MILTLQKQLKMNIDDCLQIIINAWCSLATKACIPCRKKNNEVTAHIPKEILGFQRLNCKNPGCTHLLKEITFFNDAEPSESNSLTLHITMNSGMQYYECPKCRAKNYIKLEGETILLKKIYKHTLPLDNIKEYSPHVL